MTPVIFRKDTHGITAVFPTLPIDADGDLMACYSPGEGHGGCGETWYHGTRPAKPEEYADVLGQLASDYGYGDLRVYQRRAPWMQRARKQMSGHL